MDRTRKYLRQWVRRAAQKTPLHEIKRHIIRHAADLYDPTRNLPLSWSASMRNLLDMYDAKTKIIVKPGHQVYKFGKKYSRYKDAKISWLVGPPGGYIPREVSVLFSKAGKKVRSTDKMVLVADARNLKSKL